MAVNVGAGWRLVHLTDRVIELRKDDPAYRRFLGRDGYVRLRAEPGMDRKALIDRAIQTAQQTDADLGLRLAKRMMPNVRQLAEFRAKQRHQTAVVGVPAEEGKVYRP